MFKIYLAGFINGKVLDKCTEWRKKIREYYLMGSWDDLVFLDPLNGKELDTITPDGLKSSIPSQALVHRDYKCVQEADLIIANLDTFGIDRSPTGTISEIAWAWQLRKPIIIISDNPLYTEHPFIKYFASCIVKNVDELIEQKYLNYFYQGTVNARYK